MKVQTQPTGKIIQGHVLDMNPRNFERLLKDYDRQLYIYWNPKKLGGWGCWEIRRHPNQKTAILDAEVGGMKIYRLEYLEHDMISHVMNCAYLNYERLEHLKKIDTWVDGKYGATFAKELEDEEDQKITELEKKSVEEMKYGFRHEKWAARKMREAVADGVNPFAFFAGKYKKLS